MEDNQFPSIRFIPNNRFSESDIENKKEEFLFNVLQLHNIERRYYYPQAVYSESWENATGAAEFYEVPVSVIEYFDICEHCGELEATGVEGELDYEESLWPCATARAIGYTDNKRGGASGE